MTTSKLEGFRDWVPIRVYRSGSELMVDWCYAGSTRFTQPFFDDTVQQMFRRPFSLLFRHQTSFEFLGELCDAQPGLAPTGFIFHMSRCGSTLVAQMLAALEGNIVISEAPPIDSAIRTAEDELATYTAARAQRLKWMVAALGRTRSDRERHYFIKFDSWNTLDLPLIGEAFPDVPWIFLYRDPVEVIVSQMRQRGSQMIPGALAKQMPDIDLNDALRMPAEEYCARVLARICESALDHADDRNALLVNYNELPEAVTGVIREHFRVSYTPEEIEQMRHSAQFNAKTPQMFFAPDSEEKRNEASDTARAAAETWVNPLYRKLEDMRRKGREK